MSAEDRQRWDTRHAAAGVVAAGTPRAPEMLAGLDLSCLAGGHALELACGRGAAALWLASRGMHVHGVDVSPAAIRMARALLSRSGYAERARFEVFDLDEGLPDGPRVDLLLCRLFRDPRLYQAMSERLAPGGMLAIAILSEVGAAAAPFRAHPGELRQAFAALEPLACGERDGKAWYVGRRR